MLIIFKSKAAADIIMYKEHIAPVLDLLEKSTERGVITAKETDHAIKQIEELIEEEKRQQSLQAQVFEEDLDEIEKKKMRNTVSLSARLFPLLEMLKAANKKQTDILWGI